MLSSLVKAKFVYLCESLNTLSLIPMKYFKTTRDEYT